MDDLISRSALLYSLNEQAPKPTTDDLYTVNLCIINAPAVDAVPVKYGYWTRIHVNGKDYGKVYYQHENCAPLLHENPYHYCPECGAIMRLEGLNAKENN